MTCVVFFVCKQKTSYDMRISDWSSDVCSSDLPGQMPWDLPVGRLLVLDRRRDAARFTQAINLDHIRRDARLHRLPDIRCDQHARQPKAGESNEPPVPRLDARRADTLVP